jgi:ABC-2 type transport system ATP-binding protein
MTVIALSGVSRRFGKGSRGLLALEDVSFEVAAGEIVGILGDNGAGKTTLLRIISTLLLPSTGDIRICGVDAVSQPDRVRDMIAVTFGGFRGLYNRLTARQNLDFFATLRGLFGRPARVAVSQALVRVGLVDAADRLVETYSQGMRQRLHLAIGTLTQPRLLLLDEPTSGLDPLEAERTRRLVAEIARSGTTVILTSHLLRDMEALAGRILMLHKGHLLHDLSIESFVRQSGSVGVAAVSSVRQLTETDIWRVGRPVSVRGTDGTWTTRIAVTAWSGEVLRSLVQLAEHADVRSISIETTTLDEAYAALANGVHR